MKLHEFSAVQAVSAIKSGDVSPVEFVQALIHRISLTEPDVGAWETIDAEGALETARALESKGRHGSEAEILRGLPIGIKDVIPVRGLPTFCNFEPYRHRPSNEDAGVVEDLRTAGSIILGKTVTTQFAWSFDAPKTRNPWNLKHTPGGSSSGSAAAVAARQVPVGLGTQTTASLLRPAAYCGVVALKPTFGRFSCYGLFPTSWSSDHPGIVARSVGDVALVTQVLAHYDPRDPFSVEQPREDFRAETGRPHKPPSLAVVVDLLEQADPEVRGAAERAIVSLQKAGADVRELRLPIPMETLLAMQWTILNSEAAAIHAEQHHRHADDYLPSVRAHFEVSALLPAWIYVHALRLRRRFRRAMETLVGSVDAVIGPTASDLAPPLDVPDGTPPDAFFSRSMGDTRLQAVWTAFGFPILTIPSGLGDQRLPYGLQLVGSPLRDGALLRVGKWCERVLGQMPAPM